MLKLLEWAWSLLARPPSSLSSFHNIRHLTFVAKSSLQLLQTYIQEVYPKQRRLIKKTIDCTELAEMVYRARTVLRRILSTRPYELEPVISVNEGEEKKSSVSQVIEACCCAFRACFHAFYPTMPLKWLSLCQHLQLLDPVSWVVLVAHMFKYFVQTSTPPSPFPFSSFFFPLSILQLLQYLLSHIFPFIISSYIFLSHQYSPSLSFPSPSYFLPHFFLPLSSPPSIFLTFSSLPFHPSFPFSFQPFSPSLFLLLPSSFSSLPFALGFSSLISHLLMALTKFFNLFFFCHPSFPQPP